MGGEVVHSTSDGTHTETQMGSGHFPSEGFGKAAFFKDIKYFNDQNIRKKKMDNLYQDKNLGLHTFKMIKTQAIQD